MQILEVETDPPNSIRTFKRTQYKERDDVMDISTTMEIVLDVFENHTEEGLMPSHLNSLMRIKGALEKLTAHIESLTKSNKLLRWLSSFRLRRQLDRLNGDLSIQVSKLVVSLPRDRKSFRQQSDEEEEKDPWHAMFGPMSAVTWKLFIDTLSQRFTITATQEKMLQEILDPSQTGTIVQTKFTQFLNGFGPWKDCIKNMEALCSKPWFYGFLGIKEAKRLLEGQPFGTYLARFSSTQPQSFTVDYVAYADAANIGEDAYGTMPSPYTAQSGYVNALPFEAPKLEVLSVRLFKNNDNKLISQHPRFNFTYDDLSKFIEFHSVLYLQKPFVTNLMKQKWFHGDLDSNEAKELIQNKPIGTFIIRFSTEPGCFAASYVNEDGIVYKMLLRPTQQGGVIEPQTGNSWGSLEEFVAEMLELGVFKSTYQEQQEQQEPVEPVDDHHYGASPFQQQREPIRNWYYEKVYEGKVLGTGSYGSVYSCQLERNGGRYAVKKMMFPTSLPKENRNLIIQTFQQEIQFLQKLKHENIIRIVGYKCTTQEICLFMEMMDCSLWKTIIMQKEEGGKFSVKQLIDFGRQISSGLSYLHRSNIAHRDLKSDNILVNLNHENLPSILRITDFGTAKQFESFHSSSRTVIGTIAWMAPEVFTGQYEAMPADIWSFGIILYELLSLERPPKTRAKPELKSSVTFDPSYAPLVATYDICTNINPTQRPTAMDLLTRFAFMGL